MKYAIIQIQGHQYQIEEGQELVIDRLDQKENAKIKLDHVLFYQDDKTIKIGTPELKDIEITAKILKHFKDKKVRIFKYKAKTRYRKRMGFRASVTKIKILKVISKKNGTYKGKRKS